MFSFFKRKPLIQIQEISKTFCIYPFKSIEIMPNGTIKPCCNFNGHIQDDGHEMSVYEHSLENIWNSSEMQNIRRAMAVGEPVEKCNLCLLQEQQGQTSIRQHANNKFERGYLNEKLEKISNICLNTIKANNKISAGPEYLELAVGNLCNLKCRMCFSGYSSAIASDPLHSKWATSAGLARWQGSSTTIAPQRVIGIAYVGLSLPEMAAFDQTSWTNGDAIIRVSQLTSNLVGFSIKIADEKPSAHPLMISVNGQKIFDEVLAEGVEQLNFEYKHDVNQGDLEFRIQSDVFNRAENGKSVGVGITEMKLFRDGGKINTFAINRFESKKQWFQDSNFISNEVLAHPENLKRIYVIGGEPLLSKELREIMERLISLDLAKNIVLAISTNGTILNEEWIKLALHFKEIALGISIDGYKQLNDYIRYPSDWNTISSSLDRYKAEKNFNLDIAITVQNYNALYLSELIDFCISNKFGFQVLFLQYPYHLSVFKMPKQLRIESANKLKAYVSTLKRHYLDESSLIKVNELISVFETPVDYAFDDSIVHSFMQFTNDLDRSRGQNIKLAAPELVFSLESANFPWDNEGKFTQNQISS